MTDTQDSPRISEQAQHEAQERFYDSVGRPRKLAAGAMSAMQREYKKGIGTKELAERYGVSRSLVLTIVYFTPKGQPKQQAKPARHSNVIQFAKAS
jgi:hypothetical protein